jgi:hypothetical protein
MEVDVPPGQSKFYESGHNAMEERIAIETGYNLGCSSTSSVEI